MGPAIKDAPETIGIIAGNGLLPLEVAKQVRASGKRAFLLVIEGEGDEDFLDYPNKVLSFGQLGEVYSTLRQENAQKVIFAGGVQKRPDFSAIKLDWKTVKTLPKILTLLTSGDNTLLSGVVSIFENEGFEVLGVREIVPDIFAPNGLLVGKEPSKKTMADVAKGMKACKQLGALDAGQAVIVENGRIIALEAAEGTDAMMERVKELRRLERISKPKTGGVLVKAMKPGQEQRMDLPTVGPQTVSVAHQAGLSGIAVETGNMIILEREKTLQAAKDLGLFILGTSDKTHV